MARMRLEEALAGLGEQEILDALFSEVGDRGLPLDERRGEDTITIIKRIVKDHQYEKIQGQVVDAFTASAILKVYEALNEKNKKKFAALQIKRMADVAWKLIKR